MRRSLLAALALLPFCLAAKCEDPLAVLARNYTQMQQVNITYEALITFELSPYALKDPANQGPLVEPRWQSHVFFSANQVGFYIENSRLGKEPDLYSFSYDGSTYETFLGPDRVLEVSKQSARVPPALWNSDPLVLPVAAFATSHNEFKEVDCLWRDVANPAFWMTARSSFSPSGTDRLLGTVDGNRIGLVPAGDSPLGISGWESQRGTTGKLRSDYAVVERGDALFKDHEAAKSFYFPRKAVYRIYAETGELERTDTMEITRLTVNDPNFSASRFTVDPKKVAHTFDLDSRTWIKPVK